jgi:hypothetical protein
MADVPTQDHFALLGLPLRFELDTDTLEARLADRTDAGMDAQIIDECRRVLSDPVKRAECLLERLGLKQYNDPTLLPGGFRELISILHTQIAEANGSALKLAKVEQKLRDHKRAHTDRIGFLFRQLAAGDNPIVQRDRRRSLRAQINALKMLEELDELVTPKDV